ncbi:hypothetical protein [Oceanospirillum sanctuarii]|uniref:hypothetical protein n=1 Tax=Oceanospirillum sanctuarii TaxID=1434821 RepID=UPI000A37E5EF|nr:hypothetical protein [Oceanospirillum sanctuarii]
MKKTLLAAAISSALTLTGCLDSDNIDQSAAPKVSSIPATTIAFDPAVGKISTPTNLLMSQSTGLINIPETGDIYESLNSLDGWGLSSPINIEVALPSKKFGSVTLDSTSAESASTVVLVEKDAAGTVSLKAFGADYITKATSTGIAIIPLKPLRPSAEYFFAIKNNLKDSLGRAVESSSSYKLLSSNADLSSQPTQTQAIQTSLQAANTTLSAYTSTSTTIYSGSFKTQSVGRVMQEVMAQINTANPSITSVATVADLKNYLLAAGKTEAEAEAAKGGNPTISSGSLVLPYYLETPSSTGGLTSSWKNSDDVSPRPGNYAPVKQSDQTVNVFISTPSGTSPANGWPVAVYVHGITSYKETAAAIAGNLAAQGIALVAIDLPLHGSRSIDFDSDGVYEVTATDKGAGDKYVKGSPLIFANLGALRTVRDNLKQSISDVLTLRRALEGNALNLDDDKVSLLGVSLGSIIGTGVLGASDSYTTNTNFEFNAAALTVGGTQAAAIMGYSSSFGPIVKTALRANDSFAEAVAPALGYTADALKKLKSDEVATYNNLANIAYPTFLSGFVAGAQQVIDSADAIAWASKINSDTPVLVTQVVGNGVNLADQTVPNSTSSNGFPLGGTSPLISALGLSKSSLAIAPSTTDLKVYTNFLVGKHTSLLDPSAATGVTQDATSAAAATTEMQTQVISFLKSGGKALQGSASGGALNTNVVQ